MSLGLREWYPKKKKKCFSGLCSTVLPVFLVRNMYQEILKYLTKQLKMKKSGSQYFRTQNVFAGPMHALFIEHTVPAASKSLSTSGTDYFEQERKEQRLEFCSQGRLWGRLWSRRSEHSQA